MTQDTVHDVTAAFGFLVVCSEPSIAEGYVNALTQLGFHHEASADLVLLIDVPRDTAYQWIQAMGTASTVVVLTWSNCAEYCEDLWDLQPQILIVGDGLPQTIAQALRDAQSGSHYRHVRHHATLLAPSERRILRLVAEGFQNKEIAARLNLSQQTIKNGLAIVYQKLQIRDRNQAILYYWDISHCNKHNER